MSHDNKKKFDEIRSQGHTRTNFDICRQLGICTWGGCFDDGVFFATDDSEPSGEKLHLCRSHYRQYNEELEEELAEYDRRHPF